MTVLLSVVLVSTTITAHALGIAWWVSRLRRHAASQTSPPAKAKMLRLLVETGLVLIALHVIEVLVWALAYLRLPQAGLATFEEAMYFSFATFTTLGYGDITLPAPWRILAGIEALNGVFLLGWSTALSFAVIQGMLADQERLTKERP